MGLQFSLGAGEDRISSMLPTRVIGPWRSKLSVGASTKDVEDPQDQDVSMDKDERTTAEDFSVAASTSRSPTPSPEPPAAGGNTVQEPLYPGAQITEAMGLHLLHSLALRHGLTQAALADVLRVVCLHVPAAHDIPTSYRSVHCLLRSSNMRTHTERVHTLCSDWRTD